MKTILIAIISLVAIWFVWSLFMDNNLESPTYTVIEKKPEYEIRTYDAYIIAETTVEGSSPQSMGQAFKELGGYIFGANVSNQEVTMTAPVTTEEKSQEISMTAPVATTQEGSFTTMSFMMPSKFTLENLPIPQSSNVSFREVSSGTFAVISFSGFVGSKKYHKMTKKLKSFLERDGITTLPGSQLLQYDRPTKFPLLRTNEVKIEVVEN